MVASRLGSARRRFEIASLLTVSLIVLFAVLLLPVWPVGFRGAASSIGLLVAGLAGTTSAVLRVRRTEGPDRRPWLLLSVAGTIAILGNVWVALTGADPVDSPSLVSDGSIALALVVSTAGLLAFPGTRRRGAELVEMFLDGLVAGGALLIVVSVLVYSELLDSSAREGTLTQLSAVVIPVLDVVLATVALLLILRAPRSERLRFSLVAGGFLLYAVADLTFAVRAARGTFEFGSLLDLGWIAGYLTFGLAAWVPRDWRSRRGDEPGAGLSDALGTMLVFSTLLVAAVVQIGFGETRALRGAQAGAWIVLVLAAGTRQVLLTSDNAALRRGLERRVAEQTEDLRRVVRQNELLLDSVGDGIYGVDPEGRVTFLNPSAAESLGYTMAELNGRVAHDVFHALGEDDATRLPWTDCHVKQVMIDRGVSTSEGEVYARADGTTFPVEITAAPLVDDTGVLGAVVVFRDVTQRREIDRMKNEFLSVVSHELRTPLTSIRASLELIEGGHLGALPAGAGSMITVALESTERLTRLINDLLDIERIESGARPMQFAALDARGLIEAAAEQIAGMAGSVGVAIEVGEAVGRVLADEDQIMQTLLNLLGNAVKFSEPGTVVVLEARPDGSRVRFLVRDHGRGIPANKLETIFERFGQVDSSDTRQKGGTGLGLTISKGIVQRHGGTIWAESVLGVGTTVSFTLPTARSVSGPTEQDRSRTTILVCDDDPHVVESFSAVLHTQGYRVVGVTDGAGVAELLLTERPAVVLLDLLMPGTTGAQVLRALRAEESSSDIPVVVVSGLGPEADPEVAGAAEGWLVKPVSEERLVHTVAAALTGRASAGSVLLVEDDDALSTVIMSMLAAEGLDVVRAASATEAVVRGQELRPDVVVLDMLLPDGDGSDVVAEFRRRGSLARTPLIVYSAAAVEAGSRDALQLGETIFLEKGRTGPADLKEQVLELVRAATQPENDVRRSDLSDGGVGRGGAGDP